MTLCAWCTSYRIWETCSLAKVSVQTLLRLELAVLLSVRCCTCSMPSCLCVPINRRRFLYFSTSFSTLNVGGGHVWSQVRICSYLKASELSQRSDWGRHRRHGRRQYGDGDGNDKDAAPPHPSAAIPPPRHGASPRPRTPRAAAAPDVVCGGSSGRHRRRWRGAHSPGSLADCTKWERVLSIRSSTRRSSEKSQQALLEELREPQAAASGVPQLVVATVQQRQRLQRGLRRLSEWEKRQGEGPEVLATAAACVEVGGGRPAAPSQAPAAGAARTLGAPAAAVRRHKVADGCQAKSLVVPGSEQWVAAQVMVT